MAHLETSARDRTLVIIPTFNERDSIGEAIRRLFEAGGDRVELLVVDDASPDGTGDLVAGLAAEKEEIHLIERSGKLGLGTAYVAGFGWALERGYRAVVEMDADLSHDPSDVPRLLDALGDADVVIGSRYVAGGQTDESWGPLRRALSAAGNVYARKWLGYDVRDSTSGFRAYRATWLATQDLTTIRSEGYSFQIEMTRRAHLSGAHMVEIPIHFVDRERGRSKMSRRIVLEALWSVTRWGLKDHFGTRHS
jgi:dolichol-phosphate mannosyltransferase